MNKSKISIVIPLYYAEHLWDILPEELEKLALANQDYFDTEIIFVDDGSKDKTFDLVRSLKPKNFIFKAIRLARNFKSYIAILAGIQNATGDYITFLPQDLQEPPDLVHRLFLEIQQGYDVAWAVRRTLADRLFDRISSHLFHRLRNYFWSEWPKTGADMFMISRPVADVLLSMQEKNSHITGQI
ncbi:glycosyltransferase, partial [Spirulina sp. 06S082]|uniref:glycosyltransferase n=1 Tax=Spirulina sp. 06S082 TaxID=3110248 RepID=UPI002B1F5C97